MAIGFSRDNPAMSFEAWVDTATAIVYRLTAYVVNNAMDDPAMLAIIFC